MKIFAIGKPNKKASLSLSINAIVIVVLAMTLLGLGLGFIKGMFGKLQDISTTTFEKTEENLNRDLTTSKEPLIFSKSRFTMPRGSTSLEGFGVKNDGDVAINFGIKIELFKCPDSLKDQDGKCSQAPAEWFEYLTGDEMYTVRPADSKTAKVQIKVPKNAKRGPYLFVFKAYKGAWPEDGECAGDYNPADGTGCETFGQTEFFLTVG